MATTKIITKVTDLNAASSTNGLKMPTGGAYSGTPTDGMVRNSSETGSQGSANVMQHFNGTEWKNFDNLPNPLIADYLVVAGGGGSGSNFAAGSGAGGLRTSYGTYRGGLQPVESTLQFSSGTTYTITVGGGGAGTPTTSNLAGNNGVSSSISGADISTIESTYGGYGASGGSSGRPASNGGSGGGGGCPGAQGLAVTSPLVHGFNGGPATSTNGGNAGGGGAGGQGAGPASGGFGFAGGLGLENQITGSSGVFYAGGGGGGSLNNQSPALGGSGIGGDGGVCGGAPSYPILSNATAGSPNTGSGGGGGSAAGGGGGAGGSGVVILRMPTANYTGTTTGSPTVTTNGTDTILTYTGSGTYTA
jgi:hypothetical protein